MFDGWAPAEASHDGVQMCLILGGVYRCVCDSGRCTDVCVCEGDSVWQAIN